MTIAGQGSTSERPTLLRNPACAIPLDHHLTLYQSVHSTSTTERVLIHGLQERKTHRIARGDRSVATQEIGGAKTAQRGFDSAYTKQHVGATSQANHQRDGEVTE